MTMQLHISFMLALGKVPQAASESQLLVTCRMCDAEVSEATSKAEIR